MSDFSDTSYLDEKRSRTCALFWAWLALAWSLSTRVASSRASCRTLTRIGRSGRDECRIDTRSRYSGVLEVRLKELQLDVLNELKEVGGWGEVVFCADPVAAVREPFLAYRILVGGLNECVEVPTGSMVGLG